MGSLDQKAAGRALEAARAHWPNFAVRPEAFKAALEAAVGSGITLGALHVNDLYLAVGCLAHDAEALATFEKVVIAEVKPSVARSCKNKSTLDDVLQITREKLLFGTPGTDDPTPKLAQYTGKGPLVAWVRVVAVREALMSDRKTKRERVHDDTVLLAGATTAASLELSMLKRLHGGAFRTAVQEALGRLTAEQRTILRFHAKDKLGIDQIAPMLGIHRATAARRLEKAREDALELARSILHDQHGLSESEAKSLCLALANEIDVSIGRALAEDSP